METTNLINSQEHQEIVKQMNRELFAQLKESAGMYIPLYEDKGEPQNLRYEYASPAAPFPGYLKRDKTVGYKEKQANQ